MTRARKVMLVANGCMGLYLFRRDLMHALCDAGYEVVCAAGEDRFAASLHAEERIRFHALPLSPHGTNLFGEARALRALRQLYRRERPDIVFHYTLKPILYGSLAARRAGVPHVGVVTGLGAFVEHANPLVRWVARRGYAHVTQHSQAMWFLNDSDREYFADRGWLARTEGMMLPGEGVDIEHYGYAEPNRGRPLRALFAGRLLGAKGLRHFAAASRVLRREGVDVEFAVLGFPEVHNPDAVPLSEVRAWEREGLLTYFGETTDVRPYLREADIVVLPTMYREGLSRVLLEAMATGRPILTTHGVGTGQLVDQGRNGYLVARGSVEGLVDRLREFAALSDDERTAMGRVGRELVERNYAQRYVNERYLRYLDSMFSPASRSEATTAHATG